MAKRRNGEMKMARCIAPLVVAICIALTAPDPVGSGAVTGPRTRTVPLSKSCSTCNDLDGSANNQALLTLVLKLSKSIPSAFQLSTWRYSLFSLPSPVFGALVQLLHQALRIISNNYRLLSNSLNIPLFALLSLYPYHL